MAKRRIGDLVTALTHTSPGYVGGPMGRPKGSVEIRIGRCEDGRLAESGRLRVVGCVGWRLKPDPELTGLSKRVS